MALNSWELRFLNSFWSSFKLFTNAIHVISNDDFPPHFLSCWDEQRMISQEIKKFERFRSKSRRGSQENYTRGVIRYSRGMKISRRVAECFDPLLIDKDSVNVGGHVVGSILFICPSEEATRVPKVLQFNRVKTIIKSHSCMGAVSPPYFSSGRLMAMKSPRTIQRAKHLWFWRLLQRSCLFTFQKKVVIRAMDNSGQEDTIISTTVDLTMNKLAIQV